MNKSKNYKIELNSINNEIMVNIGNNLAKVFLQRGFYKRTTTKCKIQKDSGASLAPHVHNYAEIHLFIGEESSFIIDEKVVPVFSGTMLSVPKNTYHIPIISEKTLHCAFQIDLPINEFKSFDISISLIEEFFKEIEKLENSSDHSRIASYISFFASYFIKTKKLHANKSTDYGFIIDSFFWLNYNKPIHLADLADELHLSVKQTERLVVLHTGCTFNIVLTNNRMRAAEHLMRTTSLSITEIANHVGYESHSGFWKAYKRYKEQRNG